jgi:phosphate transport system substrate-binding protein
VAGVSGTIKTVGSDTMNKLMTMWTQGFKKHYPNVQVEVEGTGSSTAPTALTAGSATFGAMSREMQPSEIDAFEKKFGYPPLQLRTSIDVVAVYVNKNNPLKTLTLPQVDAIFSATRKGGFGQDIRSWGQLGLPAPWGTRPIGLYGRNAASGTYDYFKQTALYGGDFKDTVKEQPGSSSVIQGVATDPSAIGYSGIGYRTPDVRALPLQEDADAPAVEPTLDAALDGEYPLARFLLLCVNHKPGSQLDPLRREFVRYVLSKEGQQDVVKDGYFPLTAEMAREELARIGVESTAETPSARRREQGGAVASDSELAAHRAPPSAQQARGSRREVSRPRHAPAR